MGRFKTNDERQRKIMAKKEQDRQRRILAQKLAAEAPVVVTPIVEETK